MQPKQVYRVGFLTVEMLGMKTDQKVDILEEKVNTYVIRQYQNSPAFEIEKWKIRIKE
jgi:hypothetical protein